jgi:mannose-6-phosphate isomerase-like protein (cupin superfamily)
VGGDASHTQEEILMAEEGRLVTKVWGEEQYITNTEQYCGKLLHIKPGYVCSYHAHPIKDETFYVIAGHGVIQINSAIYPVKVGSTYRIRPAEWHRFATAGGMTLLEISTHHEDADVERFAGLESHELSWDNPDDVKLLMTSGAVQ